MIAANSALNVQSSLLLTSNEYALRRVPRKHLSGMFVPTWCPLVEGEDGQDVRRWPDKLVGHLSGSLAIFGLRSEVLSLLSSVLQEVKTDGLKVPIKRISGKHLHSSTSTQAAFSY